MTSESLGPGPPRSKEAAAGPNRGVTGASALLLHCMRQKAEWLGNTRLWERSDKKQRITVSPYQKITILAITATTLLSRSPKSVYFP